MNCFCVEYQLSSIGSMLLFFFFFRFAVSLRPLKRTFIEKWKTYCFIYTCNNANSCPLWLFKILTFCSPFVGSQSWLPAAIVEEGRQNTPLSPQNIWWLTNGWLKYGVEFFWNHIFSLNCMSGGWSGRLCGRYITALQGGVLRGRCLLSFYSSSNGWLLNIAGVWLM